MKNILIAENNKHDIKLYKKILSEDKYRVLIVNSAKESLISYQSELEHGAAAAKRERKHSSRPEPSTSFELPFDAVVLNHRVTDRSGMQVAREILSVNPRQRIIFVSDSDEYTEELEKEFYSKVDIVQKPFSGDALIELVESTELYKALERLGLDVQSLKGYNLHHFQLLELLAACLRLLEEQRGNGKTRRTHTS